MKDFVNCFVQYRQLAAIHSLDNTLLSQITLQQLDRFYATRYLARKKLRLRSREILFAITSQRCYRVPAYLSNAAKASATISLKYYIFL